MQKSDKTDDSSSLSLSIIEHHRWVQQKSGTTRDPRTWTRLIYRTGYCNILRGPSNWHFLVVVTNLSERSRSTYPAARSPGMTGPKRKPDFDSPLTDSRSWSLSHLPPPLSSLLPSSSPAPHFYLCICIIGAIITRWLTEMAPAHCIFYENGAAIFPGLSLPGWSLPSLLHPPAEILPFRFSRNPD
jgi:hypothetical protein